MEAHPDGQSQGLLVYAHKTYMFVAEQIVSGMSTILWYGTETLKNKQPNVRKRFSYDVPHFEGSPAVVL